MTRNRNLPGRSCQLALATTLVGAAMYPKQPSLLLIGVGLLLTLAVQGDVEGAARKLSIPTLPLLLLSYIALSSFWSSDQRFSLSSAFIFIGLTAGAYEAARKLSWMMLLRAVSMSLKILIGLSWVLYFLGVRQTYSIQAEAGFSMNGVFVHANLFATICVLAFVTFVAEWRLKYGRSYVAICWIAVSLMTLWLTDSRTGLIVAGSVCGAVFLLRVGMRSRMSPVALAIASLWGIVTAVWLALSAPLADVSVALGRSSDLTGRTEIWSAVLGEIGRGTWLGTGFMAAWRTNNEATLRIWNEIGFRAAHAHNGYLDFALQLGFVGVLLIVTILGIVIFRSVRLASQTGHIYYRWIFAIGVSQLVYNLTETRLTFAISWTLLLVGYFKLRIDRSEVGQVADKDGAPERGVGVKKSDSARAEGVG